MRFAYGAAYDRDTEQYLEAAGLDLPEEGFLYRDIIKPLPLRLKTAEPDIGGQLNSRV